jgi:hypothetical protein
MSAVLQIGVVGFDHAEGNRIEFAYPPREETSLIFDFPSLPFIALPDGVHNQQEDHIFFALPKKSTATHNDDDDETSTKSSELIYGVACFSQLASNTLKGSSCFDYNSSCFTYYSICCSCR